MTAELLTPQESQEAALLGWELRHVYDLRTERWAVAVLPAEFGVEPLTSADAAGTYVVGLARGGHALAIKALRLVMASHSPPKRKKK